MSNKETAQDLHCKLLKTNEGEICHKLEVLA